MRFGPICLGTPPVIDISELRDLHSFRVDFKHRLECSVPGDRLRTRTLSPIRFGFLGGSF